MNVVGKGTVTKVPDLGCYFYGTMVVDCDIYYLFCTINYLEIPYVQQIYIGYKIITIAVTLKSSILYDSQYKHDITWSK